MAECITCEEEYSDKRQELGYNTCLDCGQADAIVIANARTKQKLAEIAPHTAVAEFVKSEERVSHDHDSQLEDD
jgi:hypothetical protein